MTGPLYCNNEIPAYKTNLNLISEFVKYMNLEQNKRLPYFSFTISNFYTHDHIAPRNYDLYFKKTIEQLENGGYLKNTMLVLFSDHGVRLNWYAMETEYGKLEKTNPFLSIRLPEVFWKSAYFRNAKENKFKLISHLDTYKTLKHFQYINKHRKLLDDTEDSQVKKCREYFSKSDFKIRSLRGISLFEEIPSDRTCSDAMVPINYCGCKKEIPFNNEARFIQETKLRFSQIATFFKNNLKSMIDAVQSKCIPFEFDRIVSAKKIVNKEKNFYQFNILFQPGNAEFDATFNIFKSHFSPFNIFKSANISLIGVINRVSIYGNQSNCLSEHKYYGYCYCK